MVDRRLLAVGAALVAASVLLGLLVTQLGTPGFDPWLVGRGGDHLRRGVVGDVLFGTSWIGYSWKLGLVAVGSAGVVLLLTRAVLGPVRILLATAVAAMSMAGLKQAFGRPRPGFDPLETVGSTSMPSGHATESAAVALALVLALPPGRARRIGVVGGTMFALLVGASRVTRGMHFPTDVVAGWLLGAGVACLFAGLLPARVAR